MVANLISLEKNTSMHYVSYIDYADIVYALYAVH